MLDPGECLLGVKTILQCQGVGLPCPNFFHVRDPHAPTIAPAATTTKFD